MSLKENVDFIKKELDSEEKFLENFVKVERFYKKNKKILFGIVVLVGISIVGYAVKGYLDEQNKIESNIAFSQFLEDNKNEKALETLQKTNNNLYQVALYIKSKDGASKENITNEYLNDLLLYKEAVETKNINELDKLSLQNEFLLKDFAILNKALLLTQENKFSEAKESLNLIPAESKAYELATKLNHYLLTK